MQRLVVVVVMVVVVLMQVNMVVGALTEKLTEKQRAAVKKHPQVAYLLPEFRGSLIVNYVVEEDMEANPRKSMYYWALWSRPTYWISMGRDDTRKRKVTLEAEDVKLVTAEKDAKVEHPMDKLNIQKFPELFINLDPYPDPDSEFENVKEQVEGKTGKKWNFVADWARKKRWDLWGISEDGTLIFNLDPNMDGEGYTRHHILTLISQGLGDSTSFQKFRNDHTSFKIRLLTAADGGTSGGATTGGSSGKKPAKLSSDHS